MFRIILPALLAFAVFAAGCGSTPASPEETGSVRVISSPPGAAVYPDSGNRSTTPATIPAIVAGTCTIGIRASGYNPWSAPVTVKAGNMLNISAMPATIPPTAMPVTFATAAVPAQPRGYPEIRIDGYRTYPQGSGSSTQNPVPIIIHTEGFNTGDAGAREVTVSANLNHGGLQVYGGLQVCGGSVCLGTPGAGGNATDTMASCQLPSGVSSGDLAIRFENVVVTP